MSFNSKKKLCGVLILFLLILSFMPVLFLGKKQPQGEPVSGEEVVVLNRLLKRIEEDKGRASDVQDVLIKMAENWQKDNISFSNWKEWWQEISSVYGIPGSEIIQKYQKKYHNSSFFLKEDLYESFDLILTYVDSEDKVTWANLVILGDHTNVTDIDGISLAENEVYTDQGRWVNNINKENLSMQNQALYLTYNDEIWGVMEKESKAELSNVWIVNNDSEKLTYFYNNYYVMTDNTTEHKNIKEMVADLFFQKGSLKIIDSHNERVAGKVIRLTETGVELENGMSYEFDDKVQLYRLFGQLKNVGKNEIRLGYSFTDFVVEDKKIKACLLVKDEVMEYIRVLIKNSDYSGYYHEEIVARCDVDMEVKIGEKVEVIPANEKFVLSYKEMEDKRIYMTPKALTGKIYFDSFTRNNGNQGYHGRFEVEKREEGIILINEVLLEEYLYAVVPSEMPANYPMEALKAQAITARTYAYERLLNPGLASFGANLDDSTGYQVYNNIVENINTTRAVKETKGELLFYQGEPAATYYYSTSCGFGTNGAIWNNNGENPHPYLQAKEMGIDNDNPIDLTREDNFAGFIKSKDGNHFESEESWYRWTYKSENIDAIKENLISCYAKYPDSIIALKEGFSEQEFKKDMLEIEDIKVEKRNEGGVIASLILSTNIGDFRIKNEYYVRTLLADSSSSIKMHDGKTYKTGSLLPSAFFIIEIQKDEERVTGMKLIGGGFGHGAGMSQNGAKNLAHMNWKSDDILSFYYPGCEVINHYD